MATLQDLVADPRLRFVVEVQDGAVVNIRFRPGEHLPHMILDYDSLESEEAEDEVRAAVDLAFPDNPE